MTALAAVPKTQDIFDNPDGYWKALDDYTLELDTVIPAPDVLNWIDFPAQKLGVDFQQEAVGVAAGRWSKPE